MFYDIIKVSKYVISTPSDRDGSLKERGND